MSERAIQKQAEEIFNLPRPQDTYKILPEETQVLIRETLLGLQAEIRSHNRELEILDAGTKEYLAISHLRSSCFLLFMQISGANSAEEQHSAVTKAVLKLEVHSEKDRRSHEAAMKRIRDEALAGLVESTSPAEMRSHIQQQDAVDRENGVVREEESPFKLLARKHAEKAEKKEKK